MTNGMLFPLLALVAAFAGFTVFMGRRRPRVVLVAWLVVICFVPIWVEARVLVPWSAASALGVLVLGAILSRKLPQTWHLADLLVIFLFLWATIPFSVGRLSLSALAGVLCVWLVGYGLGRAFPTHIDHQWIYGAVAVLFTVVAGLAVVEFLSGWHGLASWGPNNATRAGWGAIQGRGGLERSEGAFGHSIALGASLAMALVLAVECRFRPWIRAVMISIMLTGIAVTLSRTAIICAALGLVLATAFLRSQAAKEMRVWLVGLSVVGSLLIVPFILGVLAESSDAEGSAAYRGSLLSLVPYIHLFGVSNALEVTATGRAYFAGYRSIDSQFILFGLTYGWMTLLSVLGLLVLATLQVLRGRAHAPTVAMVAQVPALATVALITQYHLFFWFVVGLAVASGAALRRSSSTMDQVLPPQFDSYASSRDADSHLLSSEKVR